MPFQISDSFHQSEDLVVGRLAIGDSVWAEVQHLPVPAVQFGEWGLQVGNRVVFKYQDIPQPDIWLLHRRSAV